MLVNYRITIAAIVITLSGCAQHDSESMLSGAQLGDVKRTGILSAMRPGADPALVERIREEVRLNANKQYQVQGNAPQRMLIGLGRVLPKVSTDPISRSNDPVAPPAEQVFPTGAVVTAAEEKTQAVVAAASPVQQAVSYGGYYGAPSPPPGAAMAGSLVPPPPAIMMNTQAQINGGGNPYANPYLNPYGIPCPPGWQGQQAMAAVPAPVQERPAGLFGGGNHSGASSNEDVDNSSKKREDFVPITPTGMEQRSAYKQRDDLKMLWKGAVSSSVNLGELANEPKALAQLGKIDAGLPSEASKGSFTISQRQIDAIFKAASIEKRVFPTVRKVQTELVQSYYRYLYAYNKYALAQQTVSARKQEVDYASSPSEKQRATTDLAQAQSEAEAAKDDMHSAQCELANASSPTAARTVIGKISGITPSVESLAQTESDSVASAAGRLAKLNNVFGSLFHRHDKHENSEAAAPVKKDKAASVVAEKEKKPAKQVAKHPAKAVASDAVADKDLVPAPAAGASADDKPSKVVAVAVAPAAVATTGGSVHFLLQDVHVTARKSILSVAVKNSGITAVNFDPDLISASEGNNKLSDASMRADFDSTSVDPNQEVKGTITIFGRPWSDHVAVYLSDNGKLIQLKR
jgi:hypothetical protein